MCSTAPRACLGRSPLTLCVWRLHPPHSTAVASIWSTSLLCAAVTAPFGGNLIDRYGPRRVLLILALPYCAAVAALGLV